MLDSAKQDVNHSIEVVGLKIQSLKKSLTRNGTDAARVLRVKRQIRRYEFLHNYLVKNQAALVQTFLAKTMEVV